MLAVQVELDGVQVDGGDDRPLRTPLEHDVDAADQVFAGRVQVHLDHQCPRVLVKPVPLPELRQYWASCLSKGTHYCYCVARWPGDEGVQATYIVLKIWDRPKIPPRARLRFESPTLEIFAGYQTAKVHLG